VREGTARKTNDGVLDCGDGTDVIKDCEILNTSPWLRERQKKDSPGEDGENRRVLT